MHSEVFDHYSHKKSSPQSKHTHTHTPCSRYSFLTHGKKPPAPVHASLLTYFSSSAATPGSTLPSRSSSDAPPPVLMWVILSARPIPSTAATLSPPPIIVVADSPSEARAVATSFVPVAYLGISKTPIGPFHNTVLLSLQTFANISALFGPMSSPIHPSGIWSASTIFDSESFENS